MNFDRIYKLFAYFHPTKNLNKQIVERLKQ